MSKQLITREKQGRIIAALVLGTVAVSYEYAFAARPAAPPIPCGNTNVGTHNPHCGAPRPTP
jgi:hypothetical protein